MVDAAAAQKRLAAVDEEAPRAPRQRTHAEAHLRDLGLCLRPHLGLEHGRRVAHSRSHVCLLRGDSHAAGVEVRGLVAPQVGVGYLEVAGGACAGRHDGSVRVQDLDRRVGRHARHPDDSGFVRERLHAQVPGPNGRHGARVRRSSRIRHGGRARRAEPQLDGPVDATARVPAGVRLVLRRATHLDHVCLTRYEHRVDTDEEGTVAVRHGRQQLTVDPHLRVRHHAAELQLHAAVRPIGGHVELLGVAVATALVIGTARTARGVGAPGLDLHRVVRQCHGHRSARCGHDCCTFLHRKLLKEPAAIEIISTHGVPSLSSSIPL